MKNQSVVGEWIPISTSVIRTARGNAECEIKSRSLSSCTLAQQRNAIIFCSMTFERLSTISSTDFSFRSENRTCSVVVPVIWCSVEQSKVWLFFACSSKGQKQSEAKPVWENCIHYIRCWNARMASQTSTWSLQLLGSIVSISFSRHSKRDASSSTIRHPDQQPSLSEIV